MILVNYRNLNWKHPSSNALKYPPELFDDSISVLQVIKWNIMKTKQIICTEPTGVVIVFDKVICTICSVTIPINIKTTCYLNWQNNVILSGKVNSEICPNLYSVCSRIFLELDFKTVLIRLTEPWCSEELALIPSSANAITWWVSWVLGNFWKSSKQVFNAWLTNISSEFNCWYLDDLCVGDKIDVVLRDFKKIINHSSRIGLELHFNKCEVISPCCPDINLRNHFQNFALGTNISPKSEWKLLGAPLLIESLSKNIENIKDSPKIMSICMNNIPMHNSFFLLKKCLMILKLIPSLEMFQWFSRIWQLDGKSRI